MNKFIFALICCTFALLLGCSQSPEDAQRTAEIDRKQAAQRELEAKDPKAGKEFAICLALQRKMEGKLTAPATADFPSCGWTAASHVTYAGEGRYSFSSWVDAQNGFGANIRTYYEGEALVDDRGDFQLTRLDTH